MIVYCVAGFTLVPAWYAHIYDTHIYNTLQICIKRQVLGTFLLHRSSQTLHIFWTLICFKGCTDKHVQGTSPLLYQNIPLSVVVEVVIFKKNCIVKNRWLLVLQKCNCKRARENLVTVFWYKSVYKNGVDSGKSFYNRSIAAKPIVINANFCKCTQNVSEVISNDFKKNLDVVVSPWPPGVICKSYPWFV